MDRYWRCRGSRPGHPHLRRVADRRARWMYSPHCVRHSWSQATWRCGLGRAVAERAQWQMADHRRARQRSGVRAVTMPKQRIFAMKFAKVYPLYVQKAERKRRTRKEVDQIICWLTGYSHAQLQQQIERESDLETFFAQAPAIHPNTSLIKGAVCGVRLDEIEDPLMKNIRYLDKLIDELAKGKAMGKILRQ